MSKKRYYDVAQICENGDVITLHYNIREDERRKYCPECGAKTIHQCPKCQNDIRGCYHEEEQGIVCHNPKTGESSPMSEGSVSCLTKKYVVPKYCEECGEALPWEQSSLEAYNLLSETINS